MQRFCTRELKIEPLRAWHDSLIERTGIELADLYVSEVPEDSPLRINAEMEIAVNLQRLESICSASPFTTGV